MITSSLLKGSSFLALFALSLATPLTSRPLEKREPTCYNITIPTTISAMNTVVAPDLNLLDPVDVALAIVNLVFDVPVDGTFNTFARYCEPEVYVASKTNTLQLLVHGNTYDRNYWSGDGEPGYGYNGDEYSWTAYASKQGYPTLAIDRLGSGLSDHPDPIVDVQTPAEVEVVHQIILACRGSKLPIPTPRAFNKIIYVGHSYGSLIGNSINTKYPSDADATVLTGFSSQLLTVVPSIFVTGVPLPADTVQPSRFGNYPVGYLEVSSESGEQSLFFAGGYDLNLFYYDYAKRGTITLGEAVTLASAIQTATEYTNPVYVVTGNDDAIFCSALGLNILLGMGCGSGSSSYLAQTSALYPNARDYEWYAVPNAGHCWQLHYAAQAAFGVVHTWMANKGF